MKNIIVFIVDDILNVVYNSKIIKVKLKEVVEKGFIVDKNKFMDEFLKLEKKEKIKSKLFGDNIIIVKNSFYNNRDLFYLKNIFSELGFIKIIFLDIRELLNDDATFIEINNSYMILNLDIGLYFDLNYFKDIPKIIDYFDSFLKDKIILFGLNKNIPKIKIKTKKVYYYDNFENYVAESLLKVKKCAD